MWLLRQKATMLSRWQSDWVSAGNNRIRAHNELCRFRYYSILALSLFRNIVGCSTFVEDSFEWPRMLLEISTWSHQKSSICHVLSKLSSRLTPSTGHRMNWLWKKSTSGVRFFLIISSNGIKRSCLCIYRELVSKEFSLQPYQESFLLRAANYHFQGIQDLLFHLFYNEYCCKL